MEDIEHKMKFFNFVKYCFRCAINMLSLGGYNDTLKDSLVGAATILLFLVIISLIIFLFHKKK